MRQDRELFWKLLEPEYLGAMMFCRKLMADRDRGDDLFQDALMLACTKFGSLRDHDAFRPWLYRIVINTFKSTVRRPWWKRLVPMSSEVQLQLTGDDPVERHTARRWLDRAFRVLSTEDQALVTLHELEGWPIVELAGLFGRSESSIKVRLHRARHKMRATLISFSEKPKPQNTEKVILAKDEQCVVAKPETD